MLYITQLCTDWRKRYCDEGCVVDCRLEQIFLYERLRGGAIVTRGLTYIGLLNKRLRGPAVQINELYVC